MKNVPVYLLLSILILVFNSQISFAQINTNNISKLNVNDLSDAQIKQLLQGAENSGQTDNQLLQAASNKGMSPEQIQNLKVRINAIRRSSQATDTASQRPRTVNYSDTLVPLRNHASSFDSLLPKIFGSDLFNSGSSSFEPNLRLATPVNYILGPDDQLYINIYGYSVDNWKLTVSPEGNINIPHVGVVNVSGKTIEQATATIKSELAAHNYAIGKGTTVQVTLGDIRSIKVIITGEVNKPGTYTLTSLSTVFNALYASGGPSENGSFRSIEIIRDNKVIRKLDVYAFLLHADQKDNIGLKDQDIIRVPTYKVRVEIAGEVRRPALFEVLPGETLQDVIGFSGGFTALAYREKIQVSQISGDERSIADIRNNAFSGYLPQNGDRYIVSRILDRYKNRVSISGAVYRPGDYAIENNLTLTGLIKDAAGLTADAFMQRGSITRLNADNTTSILSFNVKNVIQNTDPDIPLKREDHVIISSIFDFRDAYTVSIKGEVRNPGDFAYADSMTLEDLIVKAGGFTNAASPTRIEVSRRVDNSNPNAINGTVAKVFTVTVDSELGISNTDFHLRPSDMVSVYISPTYQKQQTVKIEGEVFYPGYYTIQTKNERISDIIAQAGGLTPSAYAEGGTLKRDVAAILGYDERTTDTATVKLEQRLRINRVSQKLANDSTSTANEQLHNSFVGIDLNKILQKPGSKTDLILEDKDVIRIPKLLQTVNVTGEVLIPSSVVYSRGESFKEYVLNSGGFSDKALKRKSSIIYPNGTVKGTRKFLFFNVYPEVKPGSQIIIAKKSPHGNFLQSALGVTSAIASLGVLVVALISLKK
jgi:protein involved in polysaccharide export with SLBB domain